MTYSCKREVRVRTRPSPNVRVWSKVKGFIWKLGLAVYDVVQRSLTAKSQGNDLIGPRSQTKSKPVTHFIVYNALLVCSKKIWRLRSEKGYGEHGKCGAQVYNVGLFRPFGKDHGFDSRSQQSLKTWKTNLDGNWLGVKHFGQLTSPKRDAYATKTKTKVLGKLYKEEIRGKTSKHFFDPFRVNLLALCIQFNTLHKLDWRLQIH